MKKLLGILMGVLGGIGTIIGLVAFLTGYESLPELLGQEDDTIAVDDDSGSIVGTILCSGALPTRLEVGMDVQVSSAVDSLRLRNDPGSGGTIRELTSGEAMEIVGGPRCAGGSNTWWEVTTAADNLQGWVAEGDREYYLEPQ